MISDKGTARQQRMATLLREQLAPVHLEIIDDSHHHAGHSGHTGAGESHFTLHITSAAFAGLTPLARHRLVHAVLADEWTQGLHALVIKAETPAAD
jgi:BolA family transcriptional regulator, general stress-responsive regulator